MPLHVDATAGVGDGEYSIGVGVDPYEFVVIVIFASALASDLPISGTQFPGK